ncbi:hypothetical protein CGLO_14649 [Colletotrichum gloeosporioides Cg-14]|uniref:Uncharacterized protein n=1 Tax=Colletotrichum gloeosporioides (strain Cg-14) TaxID=1237896 RepID=T0K0K7_COLGC|nr:hypothetical protein CGLO_14649 [Colletotrichum gloeosporioides Cg-14]
MHKTYLFSSMFFLTSVFAVPGELIERQSGCTTSTLAGKCTIPGTSNNFFCQVGSPACSGGLTTKGSIKITNCSGQGAACTASGPLAESIFVVRNRDTQDPLREPFATQDLTGNLSCHAILQESLTEPKTKTISVLALPLGIEASNMEYVTIHNSVSVLQPWLMGLRQDTTRADNMMGDRKPEEYEHLVVNISNPQYLSIMDEKRYLGYRHTAPPVQMPMGQENAYFLISQLRPYGWENDPEEEKFKVSTLDYLTAQVYCNYTVFFRLSDEEKPRVVEILKAGLERTLAQARHMNGSVEKDPEGGHSFT